MNIHKLWITSMLFTILSFVVIMYGMAQQPLIAKAATDSLLNSPDDIHNTNNLIISEIQYNPDGSDDYEYIEFRNIGTTSLNMSGIRVRSAVTFTFPSNVTLPAGGYTVIVRNQSLFDSRYRTPSSPWYYPNINVAGVWEGNANLSNDGHEVVIATSSGADIMRFSYDDDGSWPRRSDGDGSSMELKRPLDVPTNFLGKLEFLSTGSRWEPTSEYHGSPGRDGQGQDNRVVINEVLSNSNPPLVDTIELYNKSGLAINLSNWFLSDDAANYKKYRIPNGSTLVSGGYLVFDETDFNNAGNSNNLEPFGLSSTKGDDVYLLEADSAGNLLGFVDRVQFDAAADDESWGRWPNDSGDLYPMLNRTFGANNEVNNKVRSGPLVISEIHYNPDGPDDNLEFVEITNAGSTTQNLANWRLRGEVDYDFTAAHQLSPGESLVVVGFAPQNTVVADAFRNAYNVSQSATLVGPWNNEGNFLVKLSDGGELLMLQRPGPLVTPGDGTPAFYPMWQEDYVRYNDKPPWPTEPDGQGPSLVRLDPFIYGDDAGNWREGTPLSCAVGVVDMTITRNGFNSVTLSWDAPETGDMVEVWRSTNAYFKAGDTGSTRLATRTHTQTSYTDSTVALGNVNTNHFYQLATIASCDNATVYSRRAGEYEYRLVETGTSDFNWVGVPVIVDSITDSASLVTHIQSNTSNNGSAVNVEVNAVDRWNRDSQSFDTYLPALPFLGDVNVRLGRVYRVSVDLPGNPTQEAIWTMVGGVPTVDEYEQRLEATGSTDYSWLMLPLNAMTMTQSSLVINDIEMNGNSDNDATVTISAIDRWNANAQSLDSYIPGFPFPEIQTIPGQAYRVSLGDQMPVGTDVLWP
ncbi:MAG: lamin tail domain-containing protein [Chloroflexota bacterium]